MLDVSSSVKNNKSLPDLAVRQGQMGDGGSPLSLSRTGIRRALFRALPVSRRHSPRQAELSASWQGRPAACAARILSEAFQLASAGGCATGLQTRSRHACDFFVRVLTTGSGSATAFDGAFAQNHGSRLCSLKLHFISQSSGVVFNIAGAWKFFTRPAKPSCSSRFGFSLCPAFRRLSFGGPNFFIFEPARVIRPC